MPNRRRLCATAMAAAVACALAAPAFASNVYAPGGATPVNVSVGFNSQLPLPDLEEETIRAAQLSGREYLYRASSEECTLLLETIAETCRLTNLNINTQVQQHQPGNPMIYTNASASFTITLKEMPAAPE